MGNNHGSRTNLGNDCTSFVAKANWTTAHWGDSLGILMGHRKVNGENDRWLLTYSTGKKIGYSCDILLEARHDDNGVEGITLTLNDRADNMTRFFVDFTRVGRDGLRGGIPQFDYPNPLTSSSRSFISPQPDYSIVTTIISYDCCYRDGLFVLQMKKMKHSDNAFMVTIAHYYVTKFAGLYVEANICRSEYGKGFVVEVKGPLKYIEQ